MQPFLDFLRQNPLIALALVIIAVAVLFTVMKKLFKVALLLLVVLLIAGGTIFGISRQQVESAGRKAMEEGKELYHLGKDALEKKLSDKADTLETIKRDTARRAAKNTRHRHQK
jgi:hypothetical protein